jgi:hypothetical protein
MDGVELRSRDRTFTKKTPRWRFGIGEGDLSVFLDAVRWVGTEESWMNGMDFLVSNLVGRT